MSEETVGSSKLISVEPGQEHTDLGIQLFQSCMTPQDPSTSQEKEGSVVSDDYNAGRSYQLPGRFVWIQLIGMKLAAILMDGEAFVPVELLMKKIEIPVQEGEEIDLDAALIKCNIFTRACTLYHRKLLTDKCEECRELTTSTLRLISRSDIDRLMGETRLESLPTKCENDDWDDEFRVHIYHLNFIDLVMDYLSSDDLDEDFSAAGVHGYWYKNRKNMRCIKCRDCEKKFTPADFSTHHHHAIKRVNGITHTGLNVNNWTKLIEIHENDRSEENLEAWKQFTTNSLRPGKRALEEAEPQEPKKMALEPQLEEMEEDIEPETMDVEQIPPRKNIAPIHIYDADGNHTVLTNREQVDCYIHFQLLQLDKESLDILFNKPAEEVAIWKKEREYWNKLIVQQANWNRLREDPNFKCIASAHFDAEKGKFVNMHLYDSASKSTKQEIQKLTEEFEKLFKDNKLSAMDHIKKELELLKNASPDVIRVLSNRHIPPPLPPPVQKPKAIKPVNAVPIVPTPISFPNFNFAQLAQQLLASGIKFPLPQIPLPQLPVPQISPVVSPVTATPSDPSTPVLPFPPVLPLFANPELLKAQIQIALNSPNLLPMLYQNPIKMPSIEQITQFLKTTAVKN